MARLEQAEARFPPVLRQWDMSVLNDAELKILADLPANEAELSAYINAPNYDFIRLALIVKRLERGR
jgi:hypothetical protein